MELETLTLGLMYANPEEIAILVKATSPLKLQLVIQHLPTTWISEAFAHIPPAVLMLAFERSEEERKAEMLSQLPACIASSLFEVCDGRQQGTVASLCSEPVGSHLQMVMRLEEMSADVRWEQLRALARREDPETLLDSLPIQNMLAMVRCQHADKKGLFEMLSRQKLVDVLEQMRAEERASAIEFLADEGKLTSIAGMKGKLHVESLAMMRQQQVANILSALPSDDQEDLQRCLRFLKGDDKSRMKDLLTCSSPHLKRLAELVSPHPLASVMMHMEASSLKAILSALSHETRAGVRCPASLLVTDRLLVFRSCLSCHLTRGRVLFAFFPPTSGSMLFNCCLLTSSRKPLPSPRRQRGI